MNPERSDTPAGHGADWRATQHACGHVTLRLGRIQLQFAREEFSRLHHLVRQAMTHFQIESCATAPMVVHETAH